MSSSRQRETRESVPVMDTTYTRDKACMVKNKHVIFSTARNARVSTCHGHDLHQGQSVHGQEQACHLLVNARDARVSACHGQDLHQRQSVHGQGQAFHLLAKSAKRASQCLSWTGLTPRTKRARARTSMSSSRQRETRESVPVIDKTYTKDKACMGKNKHVIFSSKRETRESVPIMDRTYTRDKACMGKNKHFIFSSQRENAGLTPRTKRARARTSMSPFRQNAKRASQCLSWTGLTPGTKGARARTSMSSSRQSAKRASQCLSWTGLAPRTKRARARTSMSSSRQSAKRASQCLSWTELTPATKRARARTSMSSSRQSAKRASQCLSWTGLNTRNKACTGKNKHFTFPMYFCTWWTGPVRRKSSRESAGNSSLARSRIPSLSVPTSTCSRNYFSRLACRTRIQLGASSLVALRHVLLWDHDVRGPAFWSVEVRTAHVDVSGCMTSMEAHDRRSLTASRGGVAEQCSSTAEPFETPSPPDGS